MALPILEKDAKTTIREVRFFGCRPTKAAAEGGLEFDLRLKAATTETAEAEIYIYMDHPGTTGMCSDHTVKLDDCTWIQTLPVCLIDSRLFHEILYRTFYPAINIEAKRIVNELLSTIAAPTAMLAVTHTTRNVRFELTIGALIRTEATVPLEKLSRFLEPA
jgi:hypothetical protein